MTKRLVEPGCDLELRVVVGVEVDEAGHDPRALRVDHLRAIHRERRCDRAHDSVLHEHVGEDAFVPETVEDLAALEEDAFGHRAEA